MKVVIIEDEIKAAKELGKMLLKIDDTISIDAILPSVEEAVAWFSSGETELILSDIQLADGLSFEIFRQVEVNAPIIFCTAFDEYLMEAFSTHAISYLLKPVNIEKLEQAIEKFRGFKTMFDSAEHSQNLHNLFTQLRSTHKSSILVHQRDTIIPIQVKEIAYFYLEQSVISLATLTGKKYFITSSMDEIEKTLDPHLFYRANRQYIINREAIASAEKFFARKLIARLKVNTPEAVVVSKARASDFLRWLES